MTGHAEQLRQYCLAYTLLSVVCLYCKMKLPRFGVDIELNGKIVARHPKNGSLEGGIDFSQLGPASNVVFIQSQNTEDKRPSKSVLRLVDSG